LFQIITTKNQINEHHIDDINQQLTTSLENMSDGFVAINEKWEYTFVKKAALLFRKRPEELIGKSLWSIFPEAIRTIP
jgi:PAS domain-containing protein